MFDLERLLKTAGLKQNQFGELMGVSDSAISKLKQGKMNLPDEWRPLIKQKLGLDPEDFESTPIFSEPANVYRGIKPPKLISSDPNGKLIPAFEGQAFATISPAMADVVALTPDTFIRIPMFSQGQFGLQVTGHSMKGYINHGDWVVVKQITNRDEIIYGEPYYIVTKADNLKTVKFVKKGKFPDTFILTPYNTDQFEPQEIRKDSILEMYKVLGLFRTT